MAMHARYTQLSVAAKEWERLATFYTQVFGCTPVTVEHEYPEPVPDAETRAMGISQAGIHLRLPGYGTHGPILAIYHDPDRSNNLVSGSHLVFTVGDVDEAQTMIKAAGGQIHTHTTQQTLPSGVQLTCAFVADPEGNVIELQSWSYEPWMSIPSAKAVSCPG